MKEQPKRRIQSMDEWRNSPDNPRNNPKISPEENQQIIDETLVHGYIWEVQEKINARRLVELRENRFDQSQVTNLSISRSCLHQARQQG